MIVPVYNSGLYIAETLDSILAQSFRDLEVVVVDDGSTDNSYDICSGYASRDSRVKLIRQKNCGVSAARNAALAASSGECITFVDSDDTIPEDAIAHLAEAFGMDPSVRMSCGMFNRFLDGTEDYRLMFPKKWFRSRHTMVSPKDLQRAFLSESSHHYVAGTLFAREIFFNPDYPVSFQPGIVDEDTLIMYHIANMMEDNGWSMMEVPSVVYNYRLRRDSLCHHNVGRKRRTGASADGSLAQPLPLRVYRLRNLDFIAGDLHDRGRDDLIPLVQILRTRTLYCFLHEILRNPFWYDEYWTRYQKLTAPISVRTAHGALSKSRFCRFMAYKYLPFLAVMPHRLTSQMTARF